jgi:energy-coupling factor transporter ATP-binding protein EcfA2
MIHTASFRNFKGLRGVDVDLEPLTVIVGPNASGKTSILEALSYLSQLSVPNASPTIPNTSSVYNKNSRDDLVLSFSGADWKLVLRGSPPPALLRDREDSVSSTSTENSWHLLVTGEDRGVPMPEWSMLPDSVRLAGVAPSAALLRLDAARLAAPSYSLSSRPTIGQDGDGLASFLAIMALNRPDDFQELQASLRRIVPSFRRVRFERLTVARTEETKVKVNGESLIRRSFRSIPGDSLVFDMDGASSIAGPQMSEGTLLVLGLLAVLMGPERPKLVLLDDLERGLHPRAQENLVSLLRRFLAQSPETQIVATTHSPLLLNHVKAHEVRLTALGRDGSTMCGRLDQHPDFEEWKDAMAPGEFWSLIGERWLGDHAAVEGA